MLQVLHELWDLFMSFIVPYSIISIKGGNDCIVMILGKELFMGRGHTGHISSFYMI